MKNRNIWRKLFGFGCVSLSLTSVVGLSVVACGQSELNLKVRKYDTSPGYTILELEYNISYIKDKLTSLDKDITKAEHDKGVDKISGLMYKKYEIRFNFYQKVYNIFQKYQDMKAAALYKLNAKDDDDPIATKSIYYVFSNFFGSNGSNNKIWDGGKKDAWDFSEVDSQSTISLEEAVSRMKQSISSNNLSAQKGLDAYYTNTFDPGLNDGDKNKLKKLVPDLEHAVFYNIFNELLLN